MRKEIVGLIFSAVILGFPPLTLGGTITGTVTFQGRVHPPKEINMDAAPSCAVKHEEPQRAEGLIVGEGGSLKNVFVYIKNGLGDKTFEIPTESVVLDQRGCVFIPHVLGVRTGQSLEIHNSDETMHNVHARPEINDGFNIAQPKFRRKLAVTFTDEEIMVPVRCDVHPWMEVWVGVVNHPFFQVTGADGIYSLTGLEPGRYTLEAWHEKLGRKTVELTVGEGETATTNFIFVPPGKKK